MATSNLEQFKKNPSIFLEKAIRDYVASSSYNRLPAFGNDPIFDEPLVGFADGDDAIFQKFKSQRIIGDFHLTPREVLEKHIQQTKSGTGKMPANISVISYILPITYKTRLSLRKETQVVSVRWNHTRWQGQELINKLSQHLVSLLENLGCRAIAPDQSDFFKRTELPTGLISNWSQRHIAYAAGLGTFSLNDGFITPKGLAMRCGSVVCDVVLTPTPRSYETHLANCLFHRGSSCQRCVKRCPAGAISQKGHDKKKCKDFIDNKQVKLLKKLGREKEGYIGLGLSCGLCQTKVPCEARIPPSPLD
jgi:epoxyqueuosine reductase